MHLKFIKKSYWLKFAIAFELGVILYALAMYVVTRDGATPEFYGSPWMFFFAGEYFPESLPVCLGFYFLLGSIIGSIIEKFKENKKT